MPKSDPHEICKWQLEDQKKTSAAYRAEAQQLRHKLDTMTDLLFVASREEFGPKQADSLFAKFREILGFSDSEEELPKLHKEEWRPPDDYTLDRDTW